MRKKKGPTAQDVAERAGVALSTVSYVLSGKRSISDATRKRVLAAVEELEFVPNGAAKALAGKTTNTVALLFPSMDVSLLGTQLELVSAVVEEAARHDYDVLVSPRKDFAGFYSRNILGGRVDGVILADLRHKDPRLSKLLDTDVPVVCMGRPELRSEISWVDIDYGSLVERCVEILVERGHKSIALLNFPAALLATEYGPAVDSYEGFRRAAARAKLKQVALCCDTSVSGPRDLVSRLVLDHPDVTGLVCVNDAVLHGLYVSLREADIAIPGQLSLVGISAPQWAEAVTPQFSSFVRLPHRQAELAVTLLLERMKRPMEVARQVMLGADFVERGSL